MIDPGHGGEDFGAQVGSISEKSITLEVGLKLKKLLIEDPRFVTVLTRERDVYVHLDDRKARAKKEAVDIFISIHVNSSPMKKARGVEFYFENQVASDEESMLLANRENTIKEAAKDKPAKADGGDPVLETILTDLAHNKHLVMSEQLSELLLKSFGREFVSKPRGLRQAPFRVLSVDAPASLIELGFITNPFEAKWLNDPVNQTRMAKAIYNAVVSFKEQLDKVRKAN